MVRRYKVSHASDFQLSLPARQASVTRRLQRSQLPQEVAENPVTEIEGPPPSPLLPRSAKGCSPLQRIRRGPQSLLRRAATHGNEGGGGDGQGDRGGKMKTKIAISTHV